MSILMYILSYVFSLGIEECESSSSIQMPRIIEYDFRDFLPEQTTIKWDRKCKTITICEIDENLFDESTTPPLMMYTGEIKSILKRGGSNNKFDEVLTCGFTDSDYTFGH